MELWEHLSALHALVCSEISSDHERRGLCPHGEMFCWPVETESLLSDIREFFE